MRKNIEITGVTDGDIDFETIIALLETTGVLGVKIKTGIHYYDWLENLPKKSVPGLKDACLDWIRGWGNGGGDQSSEDCITDAIEVLNSDIPFKLADAVYNSVVDYSKTEFEASGLTVEMIDGCMEDLTDEEVTTVNLPPEMNGWICTDASCYQYQKLIKDKWFDMTQIFEMPDESYNIVRTSVDLDDYSDEEINDYVSGYYNSANGLSDGIIAECIFESLQPIEYNYQRHVDTINEAAEAVYGIITEK
jgi:hypothetical protein